MKLEVIQLTELPNYSVLKMFKQSLDNNIHLMDTVLYPYKIGEVIDEWDNGYEEFLAEAYGVDEEMEVSSFNKSMSIIKKDIDEVDTALINLGHTKNEVILFTMKELK